MSLRELALVCMAALTPFVAGCRSRPESLRSPESWRDVRAALASEGLVPVVVEIPAGTNDKWQVDKTSGVLEWEQQDGRPRVVDYLAYPGNYGMIPRTVLPRELAGDGDPLDVLVLGPRIDRGEIVEARPIGVIRLIDDGERDDKILAVPTSGPLSRVFDIETLDARYPGVLTIVRTWFENYKGAGRVVSPGVGTTEDAVEIIRAASRHFETRRSSR